MRNLLNVGHQRVEFLGASDLPLSATAWDTTTNTIICAFGPTEDSPIIELKRILRSAEDEFTVGAVESITSWDAPCPLPELKCDQVLSLQWFSDSSTACLVLAGGDLVIVRENPSADEDRIEIVGSVDVGISAAAWSPDEELLAIVTKSETFLFMTRDFENVNSTTFAPEDINASKHVSVGWGKKETQFQGKRAKAMRDPTMPETVDEGKLSPVENGKTTISWRGDGAYVAVNSIVANERRLVRVFTREGVLDSATEPVDGLEGALSWRPSGNVIAAIQRKSTEADVVFFERNGLKHGQFSLRLSPDDMSTWAKDIDLSWNVDSTVLAVRYQDRLQLWTMGNYHYYLKQEIILGEHNSSFSTFRWHPEQALRLCLSEESYISDLEYVFNVTGGSLLQPHDLGICTVIDGTTLKITPLKLAGVPPPMALHEITVSDPIIDVAVSSTGSYVSLLTRRGVHIFEWDLTPRPIPSPKQAVFLEHTSLEFDLVYRQIVAIEDDRIYFIFDSQDSVSQISSIVKDEAGWSSGSSAPLGGSVLRIITDSSKESVWCQYQNKLVQLDSDLQPLDAFRDNGPNDLPWIAMARLVADKNVNGFMANGLDQFLKIGLSRKGELYANSRLLAKNCTSFLVSQAHLLFTTSQHLLKFVHIAPPDELEVPSDTPEIDERCRAIERGGKLVTVTPSNYAVTLQMPRGNLETIYPRALVLAGIRQHIDNKDYRAAYLACRNHQVDTNILCDYQPEQFISSIPLIISQLKKASRIDDFLSKLKDEDVSITLYKDTLRGQTSSKTTGIVPILGAQKPALANGSVPGKTNRICDAFLTAFAAEPNVHIQNTITAHVSKRPPDLMSALQLVSGLRKISVQEADVAITHLCFLSDVNRLYDVALSLYDIPLTLLVAEQSQKDPREYMPFLEKLHGLPQEARRRFEIDNHLRNYAKALRALYDLSAHDELEKYCVKHSLYTEALSLYKYEPSPQTHLKTISRLFAEHLVSQSKNRQAAIIYESLLDYESAYPLYALAHMWRESLACALFVSLPEDQLKQHALSLASTLSDQDRDFRAAATIHSEHLGDHAMAARLLCRGSYFADATRILALHGLQDQIPLIIDTGLTEKFGEILELLADCKSQFTAQVPRIEELRIKKAEDPLAFFGGEANAEAGAAGDIPDNVSIAPTSASTTGGQSLFTRYGSSKGAGTVMTSATRKTSKTRRKEERKRAMGKKGSVYEEEYLIASVGRCIERVNGAIDEIRRLGEGLLRRAMRERVEVLEETVQGLLQLARDSSAKVWIRPEPTQAELEEQQQNPENIRPPGGEGILWDSQHEASKTFKESPPIKEWKPLEGS